MKPSLEKSKVSLSFSETLDAVSSYSFYEYHWDGPKRAHVPVWQPRQTTLLVIFDGETRHLFSTAHILLYYSGSPKNRGNVWDIQQLGPVVHSFRGQVENAPPNTPSLPKLTVAFEVAVGRASSKSSFGILVLRSPGSVQDLHRDSITVLLEHELLLTSETSSLALSFTHSTLLCTPVMSPGRLELDAASTHPASRIELITTRIIRVLPQASARQRRVINGCLPAELLVKTFRDAEFRYTWHHDLLAFAQVCRAWSCAMDVLHARLAFTQDDRWNHSRPLLDLYALAKALREKPVLGLGFRQFTTDNLVNSEVGRQRTVDDVACYLPSPRSKTAHPLLFTAALITILSATKNLQCLHLAQLDSSFADALFDVLHDLSDLRMLSIGPAKDSSRSIGGLVRSPTPRRGRGRGVMSLPPRLLSVTQLARCMARWPALTTLRIYHVHPGLLGLWRVALRPPACALTQLVLCRSHLSDRDLVLLFTCASSSSASPSSSSSVGTRLERVVLDQVEGVTNAGLTAFLRAVAPCVVYLTVRDVALPPFRQWGHLVLGGRTGERALDVVIDQMPRLRELRIGGDVASEFMLDRRSKMYIAQGGNGRTEEVSIVRLWLEDVPRLCGFAADGKWPGWFTPGKAQPQR